MTRTTEGPPGAWWGAWCLVCRPLAAPMKRRGQQQKRVLLSVENDRGGCGNEESENKKEHLHQPRLMTGRSRWT